MTEQEWLTCVHPLDLLSHLKEETRMSERKSRLFAVACCRLIWERMKKASSRQAVEIAEKYADGLATAEELTAAREAAMPKTQRVQYEVEAAFCSCRQETFGMGIAFVAIQTAIHAANMYRRENKEEQHVHLLRDIFGNPFRPVAFDPSWRTPTVTVLAQVIYDERRWGDMPILADALEEAGCDHADMLGHCRGGGVHMRGCWVVDAVLGKE